MKPIYLITSYLRLCRLEQADADAGEARLPTASLKALGSAVGAFEEACADVKTADGDALARFGAALEARSSLLAVRDCQLAARRTQQIG